MNASISSRPDALGDVERRLDVGRAAATAASRTARACRPRAPAPTTAGASSWAAGRRPPRRRRRRAAPRRSRARARSPARRPRLRPRRRPARRRPPPRRPSPASRAPMIASAILAVERTPKRTGRSRHALPLCARPLREIESTVTASSSTPPVSTNFVPEDEAEQAEPVVDREHHQRAEQRRLHRAAAAEQRRAADHRGGDRVQQRLSRRPCSCPPSAGARRG